MFQYIYIYSYSSSLSHNSSAFNTYFSHLLHAMNGLEVKMQWNEAWGCSFGLVGVRTHQSPKDKFLPLPLFLSETSMNVQECAKHFRGKSLIKSLQSDHILNISPLSFHCPIHSQGPTVAEAARSGRARPSAAAVLGHPDCYKSPSARQINNFNTIFK
jgi:hypothetical protein